MGGVNKCYQKQDGFVNVPNNDIVAVHRDGRCINRLTGNFISVCTNNQGYRTISVNIQNKTYNKYHHRMVALAFVEKPERHFDKIYDELEVNHIDGNKGNNAPENLEWCTESENALHALMNGQLYHTVVLARDIRTNEIKRFPSATVCAKAFGIGFKRLQKHLRSSLAGYVTKSYHVFKLDDVEKVWPLLRNEHVVEDSWDLQFGTWTAMSVEMKDKVVIARTISDLCVVLNLSLTATQTFLNRSPLGTPYRGWVILFDDVSLISAVDNARRHAKRVLFPSKEITVKNLLTDEVLTFSSRNIAANALDVSSEKIRYAIKMKDGILGQYHLTET